MRIFKAFSRFFYFLVVASGAGFLIPRLACAIPAKPTLCPFQEKATYSVIYMGAQAGTFTLNAGPAANAGKCLEEAKVHTDLAVRLFYKVANSYQSEFDPASNTPSTFLSSIDESKQSGTVLQEFSKRKKKVVIHTDLKKKGEIVKEEKTKAILPLTQDVVSALFYLRSQDLALGKTFDVPVFIGDDLVPLRFKVTEEDRIHTKLGRRDAWIIKPDNTETPDHKPMPESQIWIAKDGPRPVLKIKAKAKVGTITAYLLDYQNEKSAGGGPTDSSNSPAASRAE